MRTATKVGSFGAGLALAFGTAFGIGNAIGPTGSPPDHGQHDGNNATGNETGTDNEDMNGHSHRGQAPLTPGGPQVSARGHALATPEPAASESAGRAH